MPRIGGKGFLEEFSSLPNNEPNCKAHWWPMAKDDDSNPLEEIFLVPIFRKQEQYSTSVSLLIGRLPRAPSLAQQSAFWQAVIDANVCGLVAVGCDGSNTATINEGEFEHGHFLREASSYETASYRFGQCLTTDKSNNQQTAVQTFVFKDWPNSLSPIVVPAFPYFFMDFIRTIIAKTYSATRTGQPLVILFDDTPDVAALTACILLLLHQGCESRHAFVYRCVSDLRRTFHCNIVSKFPMYHFIYECILLATSASPTIMTTNKEDFRECYRQIFHRSRLGGSESETPTVLPQPIAEQFRLVKEFVSLYKLRPRHLIWHRSRSALTLNDGDGEDGRRRSCFQPRVHQDGVPYWKLFSFLSRDQFLAVRGPVDSIGALLGVMSKYNSRTLVWFSELASDPSDILLGDGSNARHDHVSIGNIKSHGGFYSFQLEAPTGGQGLWQVTVFQFYAWPANKQKPVRPCRELLATIRAAVQHSYDAVDDDIKQQARKHPTNHHVPKVTIYESTHGSTWRGATTALCAYLDQHMNAMNEVDVFRTVQLFKLFDPNSVVTSIEQYKWCFKVAWSSLSS